MIGLWIALIALGSCTLAGAANLEVGLADGRSEGLVTDGQGRLRLAALAEGGATGRYTSAVVDLGGPGRARIDWLAQWTAPQRWRKHPGNPIYGPRQTGAWDRWCNGVSIVRNPDGKTYKMFYSGRAGAGIGFAEASIDDPLTWVENPASPVLVPLADNWEGNLINQPRVVKVTDTRWRMFYTGWGLKGQGANQWAIGVAESTDAGVTWARTVTEPLIPRGAMGEPDDGAAFVPEVRRVGDLWYMWYTALKITAGQSIHLCLATSTNGTDWVKHPANPVLTDDFAAGPKRNVTSRCFVRHDRGVFQMWYSHAKPAYRIRYAESLDGVHWERSPLPLALDAGPPKAWDSDMVEYPEVDVEDGQWRLWFCGNGFGSVGFAEGLVEAGVDLRVRTGPTATPDAGWRDWVPAARGAPAPVDRFVQLEAVLWSKAPDYGPALNRLFIERAE